MLDKLSSWTNSRKITKKGNANVGLLPLAMTNVENFNLSFSGFKTATHQLIKQLKKRKN
jgi:tRNA A37 threonylcarbamoyltransferase TsaD